MEKVPVGIDAGHGLAAWLSEFLQTVQFQSPRPSVGSHAVSKKSVSCQ
jgi:hypothetical protein